MPLPFSSERFPRFNLASMSGVYPGVRTDTFCRIRAWRTDTATRLLQWYHIHIAQRAEESQELVIQRYAPDSAPDSADPSELQLFTIPLSASNAALLQDLKSGLATHGLELHACGTCRHWRPGITHVPQSEQSPPPIPTTSDLAAAPVLAPPTGQCTWQADSALPLHADLPAPPTDLVHELAVQSALALGCTHWEPGQALDSDDISVAAPEAPPQTQSQPENDGFWAQLTERFSFAGKFAKVPRDAKRPNTVGERSGISAGTEPCFACHGRLANLGALVVESPEGDPVTYSVWRCRECRSTFLNQWTDRWVRTDTLETDEILWRVPPWQAAQALTLIRSERAGDHPQGRTTRSRPAAILADLAATAHLISRQIKQGR